MSGLDQTGYPSAVTDLLQLMPLAPLGPGKPDFELRSKLEALDADAFGGRITDQGMADACRAGIWLAFNFLDESHAISQGQHTAEGSYWHALMHRREPDHANSAYWLKRVGAHPVFEPLRQAAVELASSAPPRGAFLARETCWDPFAFNDLCQAASRDETAACHELCRHVQRVEWELLFAFCYRRAVSR